MTDDRIKFDYVRCSETIRDLREAKKESHATLGNAVSISEQTLKNYEQAALYKGQSTGKDRVTKIAGMNINNLCKLADHFGVSTDYLLGRTKIQTVDADVHAACITTGLSDSSVEFLALCNSGADSFSIDTLDFLLGSFHEQWQSISLSVKQAIASMRVWKIAGRSYEDADVFPFLQDFLTQFQGAIVPAEGKIPEIPSGSMLLSAEDAAEYYKAKALKEFSRFLDEYISTASNARMIEESAENDRE